MRLALLVVPLSVSINAIPAAAQVKDLEFPGKVTQLSSFSSPRMALLKPEGAGPFPALVLHHQCAGLRFRGRQNQSMADWTRKAVRKGYVVLLLDSLGPRGVDTVCMGPKGGVHFGIGVRDALQATAHLRALDFVDAKRIAHVGFSWGAMVALLANSRSFRGRYANLQSFAAYVSFCPGCFTLRPATLPAYEVVRNDMEHPHLVLMGDKDVETPAAECVPKLSAAKAAGSPVDWHVYANVTHCWDCEHLNGLSKIDFRGTRVVYRHDRSATSDSAQRMFAFFEKAMGSKP
jgi:dienelactone hydrolase